jgi:hypothetical protein
MTARPGSFPDWATTDQTDPVSGQLNVVAAPAAWTTYGWGRAEKPPRQYWNWFGRMVGNWVRYFDERIFAQQVYVEITPIIPSSEDYVEVYDLQAIPVLMGNTAMFQRPAWILDEANPEYGFIGLDVSVPLIYQIKARVPLTLNTIAIKWKNGHPTNAASQTFSLYKADMNFNSSATAPSLGAAIKTASPAALAGAWETVTMSSIAGVLAVDECFFLELPGMVNTLDRIAGIQVTITPSTT